MRLIDADALKEKKVYSHERHEKIVPVAEVDWMPTIPAIPLEWLREKMQKPRVTVVNPFGYVLDEWLEEQEA